MAGAEDVPTDVRAAATTAWPRLMPPSLHGTRECVSTVKPSASSSPVTLSSNSRFWNTPPDNATVAIPVRSRNTEQQWAITQDVPL